MDIYGSDKHMKLVSREKTKSTLKVYVLDLHPHDFI